MKDKIKQKKRKQREIENG